MTVAERTRAAVREEPFLQDALRAGVLNYTAAARYLDVGAEDAVSAALRRYESELDPLDAEDEARPGGSASRRPERYPAPYWSSSAGGTVRTASGQSRG